MLHNIFFSAKKVMITSGKSNGSYEKTKTSEVLNLETGEQCNDWIDFPVNPGLEGATGSFFGNVAVICGGLSIVENFEVEKIVKDKCIYMNATSTNLLLKMTTKRYQAANVMVMKNKLWITGGMDSYSEGTLNSTEFIEYSNYTFSSIPGPYLPVALCKHQIVSFNSNFGYVSMVIGGQTSESESASELTYFFLHSNQTWMEGPNLEPGRMYHAASVVTDPVTKEDLVIVTGGSTTSNTDEYLDTTKILIDGKWAKGKL